MTFPQIGTSERPFIIGHRGGAGPAFENSLAAFRNASGSGSASCDGVELDIQVTADGALVVHHDSSLGSGEEISNLTLESVREYLLPDGSRIPTLEEVLSIVAGLAVFVEVKKLPEPHDHQLLALAGLVTPSGQIHVHSFDHRIVARLKQKSPTLSTGVLSSSYPIEPLGQVREAGADTLWQSWELIDRPLVEACAAAGISLIAWTVNSASQARHLLALGVTTLCGDWPDRLRQPIPR